MHAFDGQTDRRTEISSLRPRCIPCSAVKISLWCQQHVHVNDELNALILYIKLDSTVPYKKKLYLRVKRCMDCSLQQGSGLHGRVPRCSVLASPPVWEIRTCHHSICCEASRCLSQTGLSCWNFEVQYFSLSWVRFSRKCLNANWDHSAHCVHVSS